MNEKGLEENPVKDEAVQFHHDIAELVRTGRSKRFQIFVQKEKLIKTISGGPKKSNDGGKTK